MIVLVTDFGLSGPYTGQVKAVLWREAPTCPVIDLFADAPMWDPQAAAYLLAAYVQMFPKDTVFLCVIDPGVGGERLPVVVRADGRWFVGPDNGLFELVMRRAPSGTVECVADRATGCCGVGHLSWPRRLRPGGGSHRLRAGGSGPADPRGRAAPPCLAG